MGGTDVKPPAPATQEPELNIEEVARMTRHTDASLVEDKALGSAFSTPEKHVAASALSTASFPFMKKGRLDIGHFRQTFAFHQRQGCDEGHRQSHRHGCRFSRR